MEYEYKAILLVGGYDPERLDNKHALHLNKWFDDGWEYVESIAQCTSTGSHSSDRGSVIVIVKRKKDSVQL
jgi:hypothetical protein